MEIRDKPLPKDVEAPSLTGINQNSKKTNNNILNEIDEYIDNPSLSLFTKSLQYCNKDKFFLQPKENAEGAAVCIRGKFAQGTILTGFGGNIKSIQSNNFNNKFCIRLPDSILFMDAFTHYKTCTNWIGGYLNPIWY